MQCLKLVDITCKPQLLLHKPDHVPYVRSNSYYYAHSGASAPPPEVNSIERDGAVM